MNERQLPASEALKFMLAGKAFVTLKSLQSGTRYTYKIQKSESQNGLGPPVWFVSLLIGQDNENSYSYIGIITNPQDPGFRTTAKSRLPGSSVPVVAFSWVFWRLVRGIVPEGVEIWHEGRCARCGRMLTVPESISSGFGPECIAKMTA